MKPVKQYQFWVSLMATLILFVGTCPFSYDMYIGKVFTGVCVCLNALSATLFGKFLYRIWTGHMETDARARFILGTVLLCAFHVAFTIMNWGSWLFLGLSVIVLIILTVSWFKEKAQQTNANLSNR